MTYREQIDLILNSHDQEDAGKVTAYQALITENAELQKTINTVATQRDALQKKYDEHMATHPTDPTPTRKMKVGGCPESPGGTSLAAQSGVVTKYGKGVAVRQFFSTFGAAVPRNPDAGLLHASFKDYNMANITEAKLKSTFANLKEGDVVELGHESDNDGLTGTALQARIDLKNKFFDTTRKVRPDLLICHTFTGWLFEPKSGKINEVNMWLSKVKADIIGLDCDGIRPANLPYTDYKAEFAAALPMLDKYASMGYKWISIPEFGCPRIPSQDPEGEIRAAYHDSYFTLWSNSGKVLYVTMYEYNSSPNYSLEMPAEIDGLKAWI